jgi:hypothetical protein
VEKVPCSGVGSLLLEIAEKASRVVGIRVGVDNRFGDCEIDIFRSNVDDHISALAPNISLKNFSVIQAIMVSEDGNQLLISGSDNLPIELICRSLIDEVVERLKENKGIFCNSCREDFRTRHWLVRRLSADSYKYKILPRNIKDVRFWDEGLMSHWSNEPDKLFYLPAVLVNDRCFERKCWEFIHEIDDLITISWRSERSDLIVASCNERVVILGKREDCSGLFERKTVNTPGYNFVVRGITGDGWIIVTVRHKCNKADFSFDLVTEYNLEQLYMLFCSSE